VLLVPIIQEQIVFQDVRVAVVFSDGTSTGSVYTITTGVGVINAVGTMGTCTYTSTITLATYAIARTSAAACVGSW